MITGTSFYDALNKTVIGFLLIIPFYATHISNKPAVICQYWVVWILTSFIIGFLFWGIGILCPLKKIYVRNSFIECIIGSNYPPRIRAAYISALNLTKNKPKLKSFGPKEYLNSYYFLQQRGMLGNIPILEALSAFCLNISCVLCIWLFVIISQDYTSFFFIDVSNNTSLSSYCIATFSISEFTASIIILIAYLLLLRTKIEFKIHYCIWEAFLCDLNNLNPKYKNINI